MNSDAVIAKLNALAQESRLRVFRLLMTAGDCGLSAGTISEESKISPNTLSFHLKELQTSGLIRSRKEGRSVIYSLDIEGYKNLLEFLTEDCCAGHPELCQPKKDNCCN